MAHPPAAAGPRHVSGTIDAAEIAKFGDQAAQWWDPDGNFRPLHRLNPLRLGYIRDSACREWGGDPRRMPLQGVKILDIGCGGGLVSEPLALMGATVTGIDAEARNVAAAQAHAADYAAAKGCSIDYRCSTAEAVAESGETFDLVVALEIVEHVADVSLFLRSAGRLVRPGGLLVLSTINRTPKSFAMAIVGAEYLLRWLPRGTHDWSRFVRPSELAAGLRPAGLAVRELVGVRYQPLSGRFVLDPRDLDVNYMLLASRTAA